MLQVQKIMEEMDQPGEVNIHFAFGNELGHHLKALGALGLAELNKELTAANT